MIVSFSRQALFVAIPKTATHAIRAAWRPALARTDWEQCIRYGRRAFPVPALARIGHGHLGYEDVAPFLLPGQWDAMFSFAVMRDPVDRFLSAARFRYRKTDAMRTDPLGTMKRDLGEAMRGEPQTILRPQNGFVCDRDGAVRVTRILRHETLARDFAAIAPRLGLASAALPRVNVSPPDTSEDMLDAELRGMIGAFYARDFALLARPADAGAS